MAAGPLIIDIDKNNAGNATTMIPLAAAIGYLSPSRRRAFDPDHCEHDGLLGNLPVPDQNSGAIHPQHTEWLLPGRHRIRSAVGTRIPLQATEEPGKVLGRS